MEPKRPGGGGVAWRCAVALALLSLLPGCRLLRAPEKMVSAVVPRNASHQPDPVDLQMQVQRFAADYCAQTANAAEEYARRVETEAARVQGLQWKLTAATAAIGFASGPQPKANLLDLVSLAVLNRAAVEGSASASSNAAAFEPLIEAGRALETNAWALAANFLAPAQVAELREAIVQWEQRNPGLQSVFGARPQQLASMIKTSQPRQSDVNSVFSLVGLDPTAGLDPAVHEITLTRLFAERAMFTLQQMPSLVRWQAELLAQQVTDQPGVRTVLTNAARLGESMDRVSRAAESVSQTAARLPDQIAAERKAVLEALDRQEGKLRELAAEVDRALGSAEKMSGSLTIAITNFDALMKRFGVGEPTTSATPDTNSPPFNILDYGQTAGQIGAMARDLNALVASVNQSAPQLERVSRQAADNAQRLVDRSFRLGLALIGCLLAGGVAAALLYRLLAARLPGNRRTPSAPPEA